MKKKKLYVVYCFYHEQDEHGDYAKLFDSIEDALRLIEDRTNSINGHNLQWNLFEVGKEIPLSFDKQTTQPPLPPPIVKTIVSLKK